MVNNESRFAARSLFDVFLWRVVDFDFFLAAALGVVGGEAAGFFEGGIRDLATIIF